MASQVTLIFRAEQVGTEDVATLAAKIAAVPVPPDVVAELGLRVTSDNTPVAAPVVRTIVLSFVPTAPATVSAISLVPGDPSGSPIEAITLAGAGVDFVRPPIITISPPANDVVPPARALAKAYLKVVGGTIAAAGSGYTGTPHVGFVGGLPPADANKPPFAVNSVTIAKKGKKYSVNAVVQFNGSLAPGGHHATATLTLDAKGSVIAVTVTDPGSGYLTIPKAFVYDVSFTGGEDPDNAAVLSVQPGSGTPATAHAIVAGGDSHIVALAMDSFGSHYVKAPSVVITGGGGSGAVAKAAMGVDSPLTIVYGGKGYLASALPTVTITPFFLSLFPNLTPAGTDAATLASQAKPFFDFMTTAFERAALSAVRADAPVVT
jgi:hypothetical protein